MSLVIFNPLLGYLSARRGQFIAEPVLDIADESVNDFLDYLFSRPEINERRYANSYQPGTAVETVYRPDNFETNKVFDIIQRGNDEYLKQVVRRIDNFDFDERQENRDDFSTE